PCVKSLVPLRRCPSTTSWTHCADWTISLGPLPGRQHFQRTTPAARPRDASSHNFGGPEPMAASREFLLQLQGYGLTTAEIHYHLPDHPAFLQLYVWQDYDRSEERRVGKEGSKRTVQYSYIEEEREYIQVVNTSE